MTEFASPPIPACLRVAVGVLSAMLMVTLITGVVHPDFVVFVGDHYLSTFMDSLLKVVLDLRETRGSGSYRGDWRSASVFEAANLSALLLLATGIVCCLILLNMREVNRVEKKVPYQPYSGPSGLRAALHNMLFSSNGYLINQYPFRRWSSSDAEKEYVDITELMAMLVEDARAKIGVIIGIAILPVGGVFLIGRYTATGLIAAVDFALVSVLISNLVLIVIFAYASIRNSI